MLTREEAFPKLYVDADSDIDDLRDDSNFQPSSSEDSETGNSDKGSEQDLIGKPEQQLQQQSAYGQKKLL